VAGIIGIPGRLQSVQAAAFARNPRPTSSECAAKLRGSRLTVDARWRIAHVREMIEVVETAGK